MASCREGHPLARAAAQVVLECVDYHQHSRPTLTTILILQKESSHSLRPLTIAQVIKATQAHTDAEWMVDDAEIGQACFLESLCAITL